MWKTQINISSQEKTTLLMFLEADRRDLFLMTLWVTKQETVLLEFSAVQTTLQWTAEVTAAKEEASCLCFKPPACQCRWPRQIALRDWWLVKCGHLGPIWEKPDTTLTCSHVTQKPVVGTPDTDTLISLPNSLFIRTNRNSYALMLSEDF